jgi:hypothetical protein
MATFPCIYGPGCLILESSHRTRFNHEPSSQQQPPCLDDKCLLYRKLFLFLENQVIDSVPPEDLKQLCQHCHAFSHPPISPQDNYLRLLMAGGNLTLTSSSKRCSIALPRASSGSQLATPEIPIVPAKILPESTLPEPPRAVSSAPVSAIETPSTSRPSSPPRSGSTIITPSVPKLNLDAVPKRGNVRFRSDSVESTTSQSSQSSDSPLASPKPPDRASQDLPRALSEHNSPKMPPVDRTKSASERNSPKTGEHVSPKSGGILVRRALSTGQARSLSQDNSPARERNAESLHRCINDLKADNDVLRQEVAELRSMVRELLAKNASS